jgi:transcriptional regulator with XRE-family HTH domain
MIRHGKIKELRRRNGVSQTELALEFGKTQTWCARLERGAVPVDDDTFERIASAITRIAVRKGAIADAKAEAEARVHAEFENPKMQLDGGR